MILSDKLNVETDLRLENRSIAPSVGLWGRFSLGDFDCTGSDAQNGMATPLKNSVAPDAAIHEVQRIVIFDASVKRSRIGCAPRSPVDRMNPIAPNPKSPIQNPIASPTQSIAPRIGGWGRIELPNQLVIFRMSPNPEPRNTIFNLNPHRTII